MRFRHFATTFEMGTKTREQFEISQAIRICQVVEEAR